MLLLCAIFAVLYFATKWCYHKFWNNMKRLIMKAWKGVALYKNEEITWIQTFTFYWEGSHCTPWSACCPGDEHHGYFGKIEGGKIAVSNEHCYFASDENTFLIRICASQGLMRYSPLILINLIALLMVCSSSSLALIYWRKPSNDDKWAIILENVHHQRHILLC